MHQAEQTRIYYQQEVKVEKCILANVKSTLPKMHWVI